MTRIVSKTCDFLIAYKPAGVLSQADKSGDESLFDELKSELRAIGERDELYLIKKRLITTFIRLTQKACRLISNQKIACFANNSCHITSKKGIRRPFLR